MEIQDEQVKNERAALGLKAAELGAGFIWQDRYWLLIPLLLTSAPAILGSLNDSFDLSLTWILSLLDRAIQLAILFLIAQRVFQKIGEPKKTLGSGVFLRLQAWGFLIWSLSSVPLLMLANPSLGFISQIAIISLIPGLVLSYRYFFYFAPVLLGISKPSAIFYQSRVPLDKDPMMPIKVLLGPAAISTLLTAIFYAPYPDGRSLPLSVASNISGGLFWIFSSYLGLAYVLLTLSDAQWKENKFDPYRDARLGTHAIQSKWLLKNVFLNKVATKVLIVSLVFWSANLVRMYEMPPSPSIQISSVVIEESKVTIQLRLQDPEWNYRGFSAAKFLLAGPKGAMLAPGPSQAEYTNGKIPAAADPSNPTNIAQLILTFETKRTPAQIASLEDLYLWYGGFKVALVEMKKAEVKKP